MAKMRVYELAKALNLTNKALVDTIKHLNIEIRSHMSSLEDEHIEIIRNRFKEKDPDKYDKKGAKATVIRRRKKSDDEEFGSSNIKDKDDHIIESEDMLSYSSKPTVLEESDVTIEHDQNRVDDDIKSSDIQEDEHGVVDLKNNKAMEFTSEQKITDHAQEPKESVVVPSDSIEAVPDVLNELKEKQTVDKDSQHYEPSLTNKNIGSTVVVAPVIVTNETIIPPIDTKIDVKKENFVKHPKSKKKLKQSSARIIKLPDPIEVASKPIPIPAEDIPKNPDQKAGKKYFHVTEDKNDDLLLEDDHLGKDPKRKHVKFINEFEKEKKIIRKKTPFRKKSIVEGKALYEPEVPVPNKKLRKLSKQKMQPESQKTQLTTPKAIKRRIKIDDTIVLSDLAKRMGIKANEMIQKLMTLGVMVTVNQTIDFDTAVLVAAEFEYELERASFEEETFLQVKEDDPDNLKSRPPVVTIMGHVDHGKTSLLDVIRKTKVAQGEAGGITQHIGAYHVTLPRGQIVFLDTPGHEAFTAMRSRGAKVTDLVILVVAADDGVMPQTIEAINHAKAAEVPIIVAINKIDKENAEPGRIKRELAEHSVLAEDWGGQTIFVEVSAKKNIGIDDLLEMILLEAEVLELKANPNKLARGHVIEAKLDSGRGPVASVLIKEGTLRLGEPVVCGTYYGKIRAMVNDQGVTVTEAGPSMPVELIGLSGVPMAGDEFIALTDDKTARQISAHRLLKQRAKELAKTSRLSLEGLFEQMEEGNLKELNLIIKTDVHGSIEAIRDSLMKLSSTEVKINVIHAATGTVTESDVSLASVSNAIIIGFNVRPSSKVMEIANEEKVDIRFYDVIYNAVKDIQEAMIGMMDSSFKEMVLGRAEVREVFVIPKKGAIAGSYVTDGKIERGQKIRVIRDGIVVYDGKLSSLKRFKDDAKEVLTGYECGIGIENFNDIKKGDILECYWIDEIRPNIL
ncbi:MAG: translation initiation factor IF-2 [Desulfobacterales bacterium]|nr:translation initiation factor IF-2 [Desulfobacterales bacterium]